MDVPAPKRKRKSTLDLFSQAQDISRKYNKVITN